MQKKIEKKDLTKQNGNNESNDSLSSAIKINALPYGFFEIQLIKYFHQFGGVKRVRVARNAKVCFIFTFSFIK